LGFPHIGLENFAEDGIVQQAIRAIKNELPEMVVVTDVCLCEYTDHGHCGILNTGEHFQTGLPEGYVLNDPTLEVLGKGGRLARRMRRGHRCPERHDGWHGGGHPRCPG
jgi:delta-aminolevulinic acid dehydratase/porphobilinogen synthase